MLKLYGTSLNKLGEAAKHCFSGNVQEMSRIFPKHCFSGNVQEMRECSGNVTDISVIFGDAEECPIHWHMFLLCLQQSMPHGFNR